MDNRTKYHFDDFTWSEYKDLLKVAAQKYEFIDYPNLNPDKNQILWRHDLDMHPEKALKMAEIEAELGLKSVYFILLHSEFYNLLSPIVSDQIKKIRDLGHSIQLHFDAYYYNIQNENDLDSHILKEKGLLESLFDIEIDTFSFHNNTPFTLSCENETYGGLINTYSSSIKKLPYCSDSNGHWRFDRLKEFIQNSDQNQIHVLTHPVWWHDGAESPINKIEDALNMRKSKTMQNYLDDIDRLNLINIDW